MRQSFLLGRYFYLSGFLQRIFEADSQCIGDTFTISRICLIAIAYVTLLDEQLGSSDLAGGVFEQQLLFVGRHQAEQGTGLAVVIIVIFALVIVVDRTVGGIGRLLVFGRVFPFAVTVRFVSLVAP